MLTLILPESKPLIKAGDKEVLLVTNFAEAARHASDIGLLDWGTFLAARE